MTIAPKLLAELEASNEVVEPCLSVESASKTDLEKINLDEATFRWMLNEVIFVIYVGFIQFFVLIKK